MRHLPRLPQPAGRRGYRRRSRLTGTAAMGVLIAGLVAAPAGGAEVPDTRAAEGVEQIVNGDFSAGTAPWWWTANSPAAVTDGELCADIAGGTANPWDAII
ncbi:glycoside hydrolase family 9 protein, partial [Streptomyces zhihengii]